MYKIRTSVKAIIIQNGALLVQENEDQDGLWYLLPGGGQEHQESLHHALQRECLEEIGTKVQIGPLRFVRDYISANHEFSVADSEFHQVEFMFVCMIPEGYVAASGSSPDNRQTGVRWLPIAELDQYRFYPKALVPHLMNGISVFIEVTYLGDVN